MYFVLAVLQDALQLALLSFGQAFDRIGQLAHCNALIKCPYGWKDYNAMLIYNI